MEFDPTSLDARKQHAIALLPPPHLLPPQENELFSSWEEAKTRLQDYAFTQGFALVTETHDKKNHLIVLDCTRHHKRVRNTRKVEEEDRVRANTKVSFNECPYRLRLKKNKDNAWRLIVTNSEHNHEMATDPFAFREHHSRDPDRTDALDQGKSLRASSTQYGQAARILGIQGLRLSRSDYYNLAHSEGAHTPEEELLFALGSLKDRGFHIRCKEKYIVKNNVRERRVIEQFFFAMQSKLGWLDVSWVGFY